MELIDVVALVKKELYELFRTNADMQQFILDLTCLQYADKKNTNNRFETLSAECKSIEEQQYRKWEGNQYKLRTLWEEQNRKWKENQQELNILRDEQNYKWKENQELINALLQEVKQHKRKSESSIDKLRVKQDSPGEEIIHENLLNVTFEQETWGFIDYENLPQAATKAKHDLLYIFVGPKQKNHGLTASESVSIVPIEKQSQNNLDFHLAYYLGMKHQAANKQIEFIVYTKDTGLDNLIAFIKQQGRKCQRVSNVDKILHKDVEYVVGKLQDIQLKLRPTKQTTIINFITDKLRHMDTNLTAENVVNLLCQHKLIVIDSQTRITYHL